MKTTQTIKFFHRTRKAMRDFTKGTGGVWKNGEKDVTRSRNQWCSVKTVTK
jgi:hypothetical protein